MTFDRYDYHYDTYIYELGRKDAFLSNISIPLGILTLIASGQLYLLDSFDSKGANHDLLIAYYFLAIVYIVHLGYAFCVMCRSIFGYTYKVICDSDVIESDWRKFSEYYKEKDVCDSMYAEEILHQLITANGINARNNHRRHHFMWSSMRHTLLASCALISQYVLLLISKAQS